MPEKAAFFHFFSAFCFIPREISGLEDFYLSRPDSHGTKYIKLATARPALKDGCPVIIDSGMAVEERGSAGILDEVRHVNSG